MSEVRHGRPGGIKRKQFVAQTFPPPPLFLSKTNSSQMQLSFVLPKLLIIFVTLSARKLSVRLGESAQVTTFEITAPPTRATSKQICPYLQRNEIKETINKFSQMSNRFATKCFH